MKEFGLYKIKPNYLARFGLIDESLSGLKGGARPFICIKVTVEKQNWLIPIASINPAAQDYEKKVSKYSDLLRVDKMQAVKDNNRYARAIGMFKDLTGLQQDDNFRSIVEFYNALPMKHKYCIKYRDKQGKHIVINDRETQILIKRALIENLKAKIRGGEIGFIKAKIEDGKTYFASYPKKSLEIWKALYKDHIALLKAEKEEKERAERQKAEAARKRELKDTVKDKAPPLSDKIEIAPQRIVGRTGNGDVQIKIPGKNPEDVKTLVTLPKDNVAIDKNGENVIGITLALQKQFNFKLPGGQVRILK